MNTISGNEPIHPIIVRNNYTDINGDKMLADVTYAGQTLYQEALLRFMCALIQCGVYRADSESCAKDADAFAKSYINQLNKQP